MEKVIMYVIVLKKQHADLGLTQSQCSNIITDGKLFFARESRNGKGRCDLAYNTNDGNDVWGCSSGNSWTNVCNILLTTII